MGILQYLLFYFLLFGIAEYFCAYCSILCVESLTIFSSFCEKDSTVGSISIVNIMEAVQKNDDSSSGGFGSSSYIHALCHQSFPGPLVGGNVGNKELNKWIDERIGNCDSSGLDYRKAETLRLLLSLLKIACQHYGKLRSPFGTDPSLKVNYNSSLSICLPS